MAKYEFITSCVSGDGSDISDKGDCFQGCFCEGNCFDLANKLSCVCLTRGGSCFLPDGRLVDGYLKKSPTGPVFECSPACSCSEYCHLKVTTRGGPCLEVIQTERKGLGVRTPSAIEKGTFVVEYVGEILHRSVALERLSKKGSQDSCYLLVFSEHTSSGVVLKTHIDAEHKGNTSRFINHSCEPSLAVVPVRGTSIIPKICLFAARDIAPGEEVCFHYGEDDPSSQQKRKACHCGTRSCSGVLPFAATT